MHLSFKLHLNYILVYDWKKFTSFPRIILLMLARAVEMYSRREKDIKMWLNIMEMKLPFVRWLFA